MDVAGVNRERRERDHSCWNLSRCLRAKHDVILEVCQCAGERENKSRKSTSALIAAWFSAAGAALLVLHRNMVRSGAAASAEVSANPRRSTGNIPDAEKGQEVKGQ